MCKPNKSKEIDPKILRELLSYDLETGLFTWKPRESKWFKTEASCKSWNTRYANKHALTTNAHGYREGAILNRAYRAHRVAYAIHHGAWPEETIDHINGVPDDNRIVNLRSVSHAENGKNQKLSTNNTSGVVGVFWCNTYQKWQAQIRIKGKNENLGRFTDKKDAIKARQDAEKLHGFHENHGRDLITGAI